MEDVNKRRRTFLPLSKLKCDLQEINSREILLKISLFKRTGINATKFEKVRINFKEDDLAAVAVVDAKTSFLLFSVHF